ncbi:MAG: DUF3108 domain-containing protein [Alphaproteobacteria bacterium]|nr:DUF3108 domain-containing protein [Alphaproteobacteria bacterium]
MKQRATIARRSPGASATIAATTIVAFGLSLHDGAAWAQASAPIGTGRVVSLEYEFTVGGLRAFRAEGVLRLDGERYVVDSKFSKEGLIAALSSTFNGANRAWGLARPQGLRPLGGWSWIQFRDTTRTWQVGYRGDGSYREEHKPPFAPRSDRTVTSAQKHDAFDPLTAAVSGALAGRNPCDRTYPVFDSKRRFDVTVRAIGVEALTEGEIKGVAGQTLVCEAVMKRIAGYDAERMKQDAYEKRAPKLWFATLNGFDRLVPVKMEMATSFGTLLGKLKSYNVRPMTPEDRVAMNP